MRQSRQGRFLCIGHRGAMGHAPENTLASIRRALELGSPCVEIDVRLVDGRLIVFHDERLDRTTDGSGNLHDLTFEILRTLDAGEGERIPTLDEVFDTVDRRAGVNIELKEARAVRPTVEAIAARRERGWSDELFLVSSFDHRAVAEVRRLDPRIRIGALLVGLPLHDAAPASELGAFSIHPSLSCIDRRFVEDAHRRGLRVYVFTVNEPSAIRDVHELGADGVFTDYPERVLGLFPDENRTPGFR